MTLESGASSAPHRLRLLAVAVVACVAALLVGTPSAHAGGPYTYFGPNGSINYLQLKNTQSGYLTRVFNTVLRPSNEHFKLKYFYPSGSSPANYVEDVWTGPLAGITNPYSYQNIAGCQNYWPATLQVTCEWYSS